jgi:hypothetical protein
MLDPCVDFVSPHRHASRIVRATDEEQASDHYDDKSNCQICEKQLLYTAIRALGNNAR